MKRMTHLQEALAEANLAMFSGYLAAHGGMHGWIWPLSWPPFLWVGFGFSVLNCLLALLCAVVERRERKTRGGWEML